MTKYNDGGNDGNRSTCKDSHFAWGKIEISTPELIPGRCATVVVTIEDNEMNE